VTNPLNFKKVHLVFFQFFFGERRERKSSNSDLEKKNDRLERFQLPNNFDHQKVLYDEGGYD
jgi:hypothetical protein